MPGDGARRQASPEQRFAAAVAAFGLVLRKSSYRGEAGFELARGLAESAAGPDPNGYRAEFIGLVRRTEGLAR
jgi:Ca-activated chloride channel family protein